MVEVSSDARAGYSWQRTGLNLHATVRVEVCTCVANYKSHYSPILMQINKMRSDHLGKNLIGSMFQKHRVEQGFHFRKQSRGGYKS